VQNASLSLLPQVYPLPDSVKQAGDDSSIAKAKTKVEYRNTFLIRIKSSYRT
jgi:hypothetical protein